MILLFHPRGCPIQQLSRSNAPGNRAKVQGQQPKSHASPGDMSAYWHRRATQYIQSRWTKASMVCTVLIRSAAYSARCSSRFSRFAELEWNRSQSSLWTKTTSFRFYANPLPQIDQLLKDLVVERKLDRSDDI
jgi:hypothetical protein